MTKPTNRWFSPFCARPPTKPPRAPERPAQEIQPKAKRGPYKRVLIPRDPHWRLGGDDVSPAAAAGQTKEESP